MNILREAKPPYRHRRLRWPLFIAGLLYGTATGAIVFFGWYIVGIALILGGVWISGLRNV